MIVHRLSTKPKHLKKLAILSGVAVLCGGLFMPLPALAAVTQPAAAPRISFTFDDGLGSALTAAAPTLQKYGISGTDYIITDCVGMATVPNTCKADRNMVYMSWSQITQLQNTYGWEIGSHTKTHPQLSTDKLTNAQLETELAGSKQALNAHGFAADSFATPYGDYDSNVLAIASKYYTNHRGFWDIDNNAWPFNDLLINDMQVQAGVTVDAVKTRIDQAIANNQWLVLTFHEIRTTASTNPQDYQYNTADLDAIAAYAKQKIDAGALKAVKIKDGLVTSTVNLLSNSGFDSGIASGWSTNTPSSVVQDTASHGSYVSGAGTGPTNSIKFTAGTVNTHLFSPMVTVDSTQTYLVKGFLNLQARTSGEVGYYIDEYDANGNWLSGQWKKSEAVAGVREENFSYKPTSASVKKASLQVYVTANSGITAYVDNFQWFPLADVATPPPSNTGVNVLPNSTFDSGIGSGWTTSSTTSFVADATSKGSPENPVNSVKMTAGPTNTYLFAPKVDADSTLTYTIKAFLRLLTLTSGEVGFYVDEYDAGGNWISGKYLTGQRSVSTGDITMNYTPSSSNVKKAGLQIILVGNSGITGYIDNVQWIVPGGNTPPPDPNPNPTPVTVLAESFASGFNGWANDSSADITVDTTGKGGNDEATHSVKMVANATKNIHLFSPKVAVSSTKTYTIASYLNVASYTSGEVAFYVDEYDAAGNWISGKYLTGVRAAGTQTVSLNYTPSSANVAKASLQVIVTSGSGITAYIDSIKWTTPA
jgi:peptidoglycan/xylan/chitin deacetylase (PgdA/CDA1 family)